MIGLTALLLTAVAAPTPSFEEFFAEFARKRDGIEVLEARYTQKTIVPEEELTTEGVLLYAKPRRIVLRSADPGTCTLVDGGRVYEYEPEIKQCTIYDLEDEPEADVFFFGFDADTEALRRAYDVAYFTTENYDQGSQGISIKPKADAAGDIYFVEVNVYLRDEDYLPYRIRVDKGEGSQVIIDVSGFQVNGSPAPEQTQLSLPEGTKIIENDTVIETTGPEGKRIPEPVMFPAAAPSPVPQPTNAPRAAPQVDRQETP